MSDELVRTIHRDKKKKRSKVVGGGGDSVCQRGGRSREVIKSFSAHINSYFLLSTFYFIFILS